MTALDQATPPAPTVPADPTAPEPRRPARGWAGASGAATSLIGALGVVVGLIAIFGPPRHVRIDWLLPLAGVQFDLDPLGGLFIAATGAVAVATGIYAVGYAQREHWARVPLLVLPLFAAAMLLVPAAGSVTTFLLAWELMAGASLVLVLAEHQRAAVRSAGVFYAVMTQLGFAAILVALVLLAAAGGADSFAAIAASADDVAPGVRTAVFLLTVLGFGSKAGLLPLHAWLPRAHPEAPSPVSALMSAAMVNMGIYGILRIDLQILGPGPHWWGLTLMVIGAVSAVFGVLQASVATDLKRLLAYSTTENMGLVTLGLGTAALLRSSGAPTVAAIAITAALVHLMSHAGFKTLCFLAAGSVLAATGLRDLDKLGGLARRMPITTVMFGIGALGASGLPLGAGFVGEWLLLQSLIQAPPAGNTLLALAMPLSVGAVALTTGLGIAAMVKAFGVGFLARPRSAAAENAREAPTSMVLGMGLAAAACLVLALAPALLAPALGRVLAVLPSLGGDVVGPQLGTYLRLPGVAGSMSPGLLALALVCAVLVALLIARWGSRHRPAPAVVPLWACGADSLSPRMQYTATSFAEPLQRVFDDVLRPDTDVEVTHFAESKYLVEKVTYRARWVDPVEQRLYTPVVGAVTALAQAVRRAHTGSVHLYLAYGAAGLLIVLLVAK
ncbi:proton-conducting transporter transmembrane domain-containing protein [Pengzhenrongella sicca]|uniref:Hydrogenase 4 subunit B n=1 Tax=Pengzhenrongella sicca TaxID=2819238 RepID=A0A8A4ZID2_9MICO|nr:proton-conducting transporter membrane subunit [Pengzhenrongella sicca]QTE30753.1 hydrogenase 4 subunit B [Pengzhenrongella sicca]